MSALLQVPSAPRHGGWAGGGSGEALAAVCGPTVAELAAEWRMLVVPSGSASSALQTSAHKFPGRL